MRLLVIDDSATIRKLVEISFRGTGWALDFAGSGAEGLARAAQGGPTMILLDYVLPDMKAAEVCKRLSADERCARIPVVLMSAKTELAREDLSRMGRVVSFVAKPFTPQELLARVNEAAEAAAAPAGPVVAAPAATAPARQSRFSFKQKEAAAKVLYQKLRRQLESLPEWARERGEAPAAPFFARKLFTGDVVEALLEELAPLCQELGQVRPETGAPEPSPLQRDLERLRQPSAW